MFEIATTKHPRQETRQHQVKRRAAHGRRLSRTRRLRLEPLEDRRLLTTVSNEQGWAFDIGPGDSIWINDVTIDGAGNSLVCGRFTGTVDFDPTEADSTLSSTDGGFLASYDAEGNLNWVKLVVSGSRAQSSAVVIGGDRRTLFVTGSFYSQGEVGGVPLTGEGDSGYLVKYDLDQVLGPAAVWVRQWTVTPSYGGMYPKDMAVSTSGEHLYVSGDINGTGYFGEGVTIPDPGPSHAFVVKVNSETGLLDWAWGPQGYGYAVAQRLAVDTADNVYVAGMFNGTLDPEGPIELTSQGLHDNDVFVAKLTTTSEGGVATAWAKQLGGTDGEGLRDFSLTSDNSALYVTGDYTGQADIGGVQLNQDGGATFVAKMSLAGDVLWAKSVGGPGQDYVGGIAAASGDAGVYITGRFTEITDLDPNPDAAVLVNSGGLVDGYVLQLDKDGAYQRAWQLGIAANSRTGPEHITLQDGDIYVTGRYYGTIVLPQGTLPGDPERMSWFLSALRPDANVPVSPTAQDDFYAAWQYYTLVVPTCEGVLANDANPNLDSLRATLVVTDDVKNGTLTLRKDGSFKYTPVPGYSGTDSFTYTVANSYGMTDTGTVTIDVKPLAAETFASTDVPKNIIDSPSRPTRSLIVVDSVFLIEELKVTINITHPRTPDLDVFLVSPKGTRVELFTDVGTNKSANFVGTILADGEKLFTKGTAPFTGAFQPEGKLSTFKNEPIAGTWTLEIVDDQIKQAGTLNSWSLTVTPAIPAAALHAQEMGHNDAAAVLSHAEAQSLLAEALTRWRATGIDTSSLSGLSLQIGDLGGTTLGLAAHNTIWLDDDAAGWGWFIDRTPGSDSEFTRSGNQGEQDRMDLLTVVTHELGHLLSYDHDEAGLMAATLAAGVRSTTLTHDRAAAVDELIGQATDLIARGFWSTDPLPATHPWAKRRR